MTIPLPDATPDIVLYYYDEPIIFTRTFEGVVYLFYKIDDSGSNSVFLVVPSFSEMISAIMDGRVSLRSAFVNSLAWIVTTAQQRILNSRILHTSSLTDDCLPERNAPLHFEHGHAPDISPIIPQNKSFLSFKFIGDTMIDGQMPLNVFKHLVDGMYTSLRTVFIGVMDSLTNEHLSDTALSRLLTIPIRQPTFASLSVDIDVPTVERANLKKRTKFSVDSVNAGLEETAKDFIDDLIRVDEILIKSKSNQSLSEHMYVLDALVDIVPREASAIDYLQLQTRDRKGKIYSVEINTEKGERIISAHDRFNKGEQTREGIVVAVNKPSATFIIRTDRGRQITCEVGGEVNGVPVIRLITMDMNVKVIGAFTRRTRRDFLAVFSVIDISTGQIIYQGT